MMTCFESIAPNECAISHSMMMTDVLRLLLCTWLAKWAERPPKSLDDRSTSCYTNLNYYIPILSIYICRQCGDSFDILNITSPFNVEHNLM